MLKGFDVHQALSWAPSPSTLVSKAVPANILQLT
jgi:hypothetical protein